MDQLLNPDSVTLTPGGTRGANIVIAGRVATASDSVASADLMKAFETAFRNTFGKIKAFRVGPEAERLLDSGARLTVATQSPITLDLTRT
jgi:hypothetical protein